MVTENPDATTTTEKVVVLTRVFDAPRDLVWKMWTDPKHVAVWWGPRHFTNPRCEWDARPGGKIRVDMQGPRGTPYAGTYPMTGEFREVVQRERLVFISRAGDDADPGIEAETTVTFKEAGGKTEVTVRSVVLRSKPEFAEALAGMEEGWAESLDKLAEHLAQT